MRIMMIVVRIPTWLSFIEGQLLVSSRHEIRNANRVSCILCHHLVGFNWCSNEGKQT